MKLCLKINPQQCNQKEAERAVPPLHSYSHWSPRPILFSLFKILSFSVIVSFAYRSSLLIHQFRYDAGSHHPSLRLSIYSFVWKVPPAFLLQPSATDVNLVKEFVSGAQNVIRWLQKLRKPISCLYSWNHKHWLVYWPSFSQNGESFSTAVIIVQLCDLKIRWEWRCRITETIRDGRQDPRSLRTILRQPPAHLLSTIGSFQSFPFLFLVYYLRIKNEI